MIPQTSTINSNVIEFIHPFGRVLYEVTDGREAFFEQEFGETRWFVYHPPAPELFAARVLYASRPAGLVIVKNGEIIIKTPTNKS